MTRLPGSEPDGWSSPVESLDPFEEVPDGTPEVPGLGEVPEEEPVGAVVGEEPVVVVEGFVPEPVGEEAVVVVVSAVVVELPGEGAVVADDPSPGAEAAGAEVVPTGEAGPPAPGAFGALTATESTEEDGDVFEDGAIVLAATIGGALDGAAVATPGCAPGWVAPATGLAMPDKGG